MIQVSVHVPNNLNFRPQRNDSSLVCHFLKHDVVKHHGHLDYSFDERELIKTLLHDEEKGALVNISLCYILIWAARSFNSSTTAFASSLVSADRERKAMCRVPDVTDFKARLRSRPLRSPTTRYVTLRSSLNESLNLNRTGASE